MEYLFRAQVTPGWNTLCGLPNKLQNRERIQKRAPRTVPSVTANVSGPYFSFSTPNFSAILSGRPSLTCTSTPQLPAQNVQIARLISTLLMILDSTSPLI